jgi:NlpC/P60 family putative phage cell wall peptidase
MTNPEIIRAARSWIGTPYHHQASAKGIGCDCLGLVRGVWREVYGSDPETPPAYSPDWAEAQGRETMLEAARRHMTQVAKDEACPGDMLVFRLRKGAIAKHAAIISGKHKMIHAIEGAPVSEVHLGRWWGRHIAAVFRFPEKK